MPLRARVIAASQFELVQDLAVTATEKYFAGLELLLSDHHATGLYLMGYCAEMVLKNAYFRVAGARLVDPVQPGLQLALQWSRTVFPTTTLPPRDGFHGIGYWAMLLWLRRMAAGRPFTGLLASEFAASTTRLNGNWWVEMRYRSIQVTNQEIQDVYNDTTWLLQHAAQLWS